MVMAIEAVDLIKYKGMDLPLKKGYFLRPMEFSGVLMLYYSGVDEYRYLGSFDRDQGEEIIDKMLEDIYAHRGPDWTVFPRADVKQPVTSDNHAV